ncbi:MAG: fatty acid desaturase [bacterium]|nr:fatty acid desaturase [bacterium]
MNTIQSPVQSPVSMPETMRALKPLMSGVGWWTIGLALAVMAGYAAVFSAVALGILPLLAGAGINVVLGYLIFTPLHDASHGSIAGRRQGLKWLERSIGYAAGSLLWAPLPAFQLLHLRHHSHTNDPNEDPDHWVATRNPLLLMLRSFTIMFSYYYQFLARPDAQKRKKLPALILNVAVMLAVVAAMGWRFGPMFPIVLWFLPSVCSLAILAIVFDWLPHQPHASRERYLDTRVILVPGLQTLLLGQNLHLVHHLYPTVPFYKYGKAFRIVRPLLESKGSPIYEFGARS